MKKNVEIVQGNEILAIISISGDINLDNVQDVTDSIDLVKKTYKTKNFIFDMTNVTFVSSMGLGVFINLVEYVRARKGKIIFTSMPNEIYSVFRTLRLLRYFSFCGSLKDALIEINS